MIELRKAKCGNGGMGGGGIKNTHEMKRSGPLKAHGNSKRSEEEALLPLLKTIIIHVTHDATGIPVKTLEGYHMDHRDGRNAPGFSPLGAMLSPLNLQLLAPAIHREKTNPTPGTGITSRTDFRDQATKDHMTLLNTRIIRLLPPAWNLSDVEDILSDLVFGIQEHLK